jgi:histidinol-phosphate phosphatase family protein
MAVFLSRDALINQNRAEYVKSWDEVVFGPGSMPSLRRLAKTRYAIVVIFNQSAINRALVSRSEVDHINQRMVGEIEQAGGRIDGIYVCPPRPDEGYACRKPRPGLLHQAADELDIDLATSYLIADTISDVRSSLAAGCKPILLLTDRACHDLEKGGDFGPAGFFLALDFRRAVDLILKRPCPHRREQGNSPRPHEPAREARSGEDSEWGRASAMASGAVDGAERGIPRS